MYHPKNTHSEGRRWEHHDMRLFSENGTEAVRAIEGNMNGVMYWGIIEEHLISLAKKGTFYWPRRWALQQDNDPKHELNPEGFL